MTTELTVLRPCPFCGSSIVGELAESSYPHDRLGVVFCGVCGCHGPSLYEPGQFVGEWNRRAVDTHDFDTLQERHHRLQAAVLLLLEMHALERSVLSARLASAIQKLEDALLGE